MSVEYYTKKPITIPVVRWDGTNADEVRVFANGGGEDDYTFRVYNGAVQVWNAQEHCWLGIPVGHYVARGSLGELYPVSPAALERSFEPADVPA